MRHYWLKFAPQIVDIAHLLVSQMSTDTFLVDWERPRPVVPPPKPESARAENPTTDDARKGSKETAVSVWRTYLVANEWNEVQVRRKTMLALQIFLVVFLLRVKRKLKYLNCQSQGCGRSCRRLFATGISLVISAQIAVPTYF